MLTGEYISAESRGKEYRQYAMGMDTYSLETQRVVSYSPDCIIIVNI